MLSGQLLVFSKTRRKSTYFKACQCFCRLNGCVRNSHSSAGFCPVLSFLPCGMRVWRVLGQPCLQTGFSRSCCISLLLLSVISSCCDFPSPSPLLLTAGPGILVSGIEVLSPSFGFGGAVEWVKRKGRSTCELLHCMLGFELGALQTQRYKSQHIFFKPWCSAGCWYVCSSGAIV